jgi:two-component system, sensor histidine kinase LadS
LSRGSRAHPAFTRPASAHPWSWVRLALFSLLISLSAKATATEVIELPSSGAVGEIKQRALVRTDPEGRLEAEPLLQGDAGFTVFDPSLDETAPLTWLKLRFIAPAASDGRYVLKVSQRFFQTLDVWLPQPDGNHRALRSGVQHNDEGLRVGRRYVFEFHVPPGGQSEVLLRVQTVQNSLNPLQLSVQDQAGFTHRHAMNYLAYGLYFGILLALIFHNFVLYLNLRQRGHLFYVLAMSAVTMMMLLDSGLAAIHLLPDTWQGLAFRLNVISVLLAYLLIARFFQVFVHSKLLLPRIHWLINIAMAMLALLIITLTAMPVDNVLPALLVVQPSLSAVLILLLVGSVMAGLRGSIEGWIFFAAWLFVLAGTFIRMLISLDIIDRTFFFEHALYLGTVLEASILALGLSYRVKQLRQRHAQALREQHKAARLSNLDPLTSAYNRRFLYSFLGALMKAESGKGVRRSVLILDLDRFKQVNDTHGHLIGDIILCELVARCRTILRETDVLCRLLRLA